MPSLWRIDGGSGPVTLESLGLEVVSGEFRNGSASSMRLRRASDCDAAEILSGYGGTVTLTRAVDPLAPEYVDFFKGTIRAIPKSADDASESQEYLIEDAWADLERTVYQEDWAIKNTIGDPELILMPRCFLGVSDAGTPISVGQQIAAAVAFAVSAGIDIQADTSYPAGMVLWPTEVDGISIAEVIRTSLRYYPDWIPWIDHTTGSPTFKVTPRDSASALSLAITDCSSLDVAEIQDRLPEHVRIVYLTANEVAEGGGIETWRNYKEDIYPVADIENPTDAERSGPGVLCTTVDLQGVDAAVQKQQVQTRHIPTVLDPPSSPGTEGYEPLTAKAWLKLQFPAIADVPDAAIDLADWVRGLIPETETPPDPINPKSKRLGEPETPPSDPPAPALTLADVPRQLVKGGIAEGMRKKVGKVRLTWTIKPAAGATEAEKALISKVPPGITVTATNATTRIYKFLSSYTPADAAPTGVAEAFYNTIRNGCRYQGSISLLTEGLDLPWHGRKLNLTGGVAGWATMAAPIHAVQWDAETEMATFAFGPTPDYGFQDFLEYLHLLRRRPASWITAAERTSAAIGDDAGPSAAGDIVGPFDVPADMPDFPGVAAGKGNFHTQYHAENADIMLQGGYVYAGSGSETIAPFILKTAGTPAVGGTPAVPGVWAGDPGDHLVLTVEGQAVASDGFLMPQFDMTSASLSVSPTVGDHTVPTVDSLYGTFKTSLGMFLDGAYSPNGPGNVAVSFCFSGFTISREVGYYYDPEVG